MKTPLLLVPLLAAITAGSWFYSPTPKTGAQEDRGQGARKNAAGVEPRIALVIGNSAYREGPLANPVNDARDMAATLRQFGFEVLSGEDRDRRQMEDLIREFGRKIRNGGVGMFYFAGHGFQVNGANYLIPIGVQINGEAEVKYEAVDVGFVLAQMEQARTRLNIVVLDACRNNPFARSFRSPSRGLASIDAPVGTLIAYATSPGSTASDGGGSNGLYTKELLAAMRVPGLKIEEVFKRVRTEVRRQSDGQQIPWEASSIEGDFYFSTPSLGSWSGATHTPYSASTTRMSVAGAPLVAMNYMTAQVNERGEIFNRRQEQCWGYVEDLGNGVKLEMVEIPAGEFLMGEEAAGAAEFVKECARYENEGACAMWAKWETPQHMVRVNGFLMAKYEVTQRQWKAVMGSLPPGVSGIEGDDLPMVAVMFTFESHLSQFLDQLRIITDEPYWAVRLTVNVLRLYFAIAKQPIHPGAVNTQARGQATHG